MKLKILRILTLGLSIAFVVISACSLKDRSTVNDSDKYPIDYVDPFIGTGAHGHTYPGASSPYGAVQLSPDTRHGNWDASSGYHYSDSTLIGFSHTHLSGTGVADLGDILFHPTTKNDIDLDSDEGYIYDSIPFSHENEEASPGYYAVDLTNEGIKVELTATTYTGIHKYTYNKGDPENLVIDMAHLLTDEDIDSVNIGKTGTNEISGMRRTQGWAPNQYVFFVAQFSEDFDSITHIDNRQILAGEDLARSDNQQMFLKFGQSDGAPLIVQVGLSIVSKENARENLKNDISKDFDFEAIHKSVRKRWEDELSQISVKSDNKANLKNFYTALYHSKLVPNINSDSNGAYRRHDMAIDTLSEGEKYYSTFSLWDTFRAWNPMQTLLDTTLVNNMINSYLKMYDATGELPIWPLSAGETNTMIGYHSVSVIADAYQKGIRGYNAEKAFRAMKESSNKNKKGSEYYKQYGYIPSNFTKESVSRTLEFTYDDWNIARMAKALGHNQDYEDYKQRALSYVNIFDGHTRFFRGKRADGNWEQHFNPFEPGKAYTEANAWQYRFFVPQDVNGMIQLFGGKNAFTQRLDSLFTVKSDIEGEMQDMTGLIGQYVQGNEPSHHMAYLYDYAGQPWKTQKRTRQILKEMYKPTPQGISGNEDAGQISAWYILSSLGIYPVDPGSGEFSLTTPLFKKVDLKLANGRHLIIKANAPKNNSYIDKVKLDGKQIDKNYLTYDQIMEGDTLDFKLSSSPNKKRGTSHKASPSSITSGKVVSIPYTTKNLNLFKDSIKVDLEATTKNADIYYTLDGSEPTESSKLYDGPFILKKDAEIKAKAYKEGYGPSKMFSIQAKKTVMKKSVDAEGKENGIHYRYYEGDFEEVKDLTKAPVIDSGVMAQPSIEWAKQDDHFGYIFSGIIKVPEDGVYDFMTKSDDGSVLYIDHEKVVNNDGSHAPISANGRIALEKGYHQFKLLYFEDYEGEHLEWGWKKPSDKEVIDIPKSELFIK